MSATTPTAISASGAPLLRPPHLTPSTSRTARPLELGVRLVHELESYHEPLLLVSHQAVLRLMYAYLMGKPRSSAPKIEIPLHTVIRITYDGWNPPHEERFVLGPPALGYKTDGTITKDAQHNLCDGKDKCT